MPVLASVELITIHDRIDLWDFVFKGYLWVSAFHVSGDDSLWRTSSNP